MTGPRNAEQATRFVPPDADHRRRPSRQDVLDGDGTDLLAADLDGDGLSGNEDRERRMAGRMRPRVDLDAAVDQVDDPVDDSQSTPRQVSEARLPERGVTRCKSIPSPHGLGPNNKKKKKRFATSGPFLLII